MRYYVFLSVFCGPPVGGGGGGEKFFPGVQTHSRYCHSPKILSGVWDSSLGTPHCKYISAAPSSRPVALISVVDTSPLGYRT